MSALTFFIAAISVPGVLHAMAGRYESLANAAAGTLVSTVWEGAVIAVALAICLRFASRTTASLRFGMWSAAFLFVSALPLIGFIPHFFAGSGGFPPPASVAVAKPWLQLDVRWSFAIALLWLAASLYRAIELALDTLRLSQLWKSAILVDALPIGTGSRKAQVCTTTELERPSVLGFFAPRILIPDWLFARLTAAELEQIVLHETEHLRRGDDWTNLAQKLCLVLFPLNPALWWMEQQLCREREMACDEGVVLRTRAPQAYALCLASLAERGLEHRQEVLAVGALSLGAWQRRPELVQRVHRILSGKPTLRPAVARIVGLAIAGGLAIGSIELARTPQLIAFTSPQTQRETAMTASAEAIPEMPTGYVPFMARELGPAHMEQLKATMPVPVAPSAVPKSVRKPSPVEGQGQRIDSGAPHAVETMAHMDPSAFAQKPAPAQSTAATDTQSSGIGEQWVVLTTYREEVGPAAGNATFADYDAVQTDHPASVTRTTVTRLIFKLEPGSGANAAPKQPSQSHPIPAGAPTVAYVRAGWLIFQL